MIFWNVNQLDLLFLVHVYISAKSRVSFIRLSIVDGGKSFKFKIKNLYKCISSISSHQSITTTFPLIQRFFWSFGFILSKILLILLSQFCRNYKTCYWIATKYFFRVIKRCEAFTFLGDLHVFNNSVFF